jgi:hypothetical protein
MSESTKILAGTTRLTVFGNSTLAIKNEGNLSRV